MKRWLILSMLLAGSPAGAQDLVLFNGGIGREEREAAPATGTRLEFFLDKGNFIADVKVVVQDAKGHELVQVATQGPWLILDLPPGRYVVSATWHGETQSAPIEVTATPRRFGFRFESP